MVACPFKSLTPWLLALLAGLVLFNVVAYRHAARFFQYSEQAAGPLPVPEDLTAVQRALLLFKGISLPKPSAHSSPGEWGLPHEELSVPGRGGGMLAGWRIPNPDAGVTVILFHGYNSEKSGLLPEALLFHRLGVQVVMIDFTGAGGSPGRRVSLGIYEAEDVAAAHEWARREFPGQRIVLYGHSMGAAAVIRAMALLGVRPDAAILESVFDSLLKAIRYRFALLSVPSWPSAEALLFWGSVQLRANGFRHCPVVFAGQVDIPVMIIHGKQDNRADWRGAVEIHRRLRGEKALLLIEDAGHVNPSSRDPAHWSGHVGAFLGRLDPDTR